MTSILDSISSQISPHSCILCCVEGNVICLACLQGVLDEGLNRCWYCSKPARIYETCRQCLPYSSLDGLFVIGAHEDTLKDMIYKYKYGFAVQLARDVVEMFQDHVPYFETFGVSYVPSSNQHRRQRGFDQGKELARAFARFTKSHVYEGIERFGRDVQVGAGHKERAKQAAEHFKARKTNQRYPKNVFLFDDVVTTGASINRCAEILKQQGVEMVFGVALARNLLK